MRLIALSTVLASFMASSAKAQTCDGVGFTADLSTTAGWSSVVRDDYGRYTVTMDFYLRTSSTAVEDTFYTNVNSTGLDTEPGPAIRLAIGGEIRALRYRNTLGQIGPEWVCGEWDGTLDGNGMDVLTASACPTYTANTWYHFQITYEGASGLYTASVQECDGAAPMTAFATNFRTVDKGNNLGPWDIWHYALTTSGGGGLTTFELDQMVWTSVQEPAPFNCQAYLDSELCATPLECTLLGGTWNPCRASTVPFCAGQPPLNNVPNPTGNRRTPADHYATATIPVASSVVIGPSAALFSAHQLDDPDPVGGAYITSGFPKILKPEAAGGNYAINRAEWFRRGLVADATRYPDFAIGYVRGSVIPPPYVDEVYDPATDSVNCDDILLHGYAGGGVINYECSYHINQFADTADYVLGSSSLAKNYIGACIDPAGGSTTGGDSGGPIYAIGDWDGAGPGTVYPKLVGVNGEGQSWQVINALDAPDMLAWYLANKDAPVAKLMTGVGVGLDIDDAWIDYPGNQHDITAAPLDLAAYVTPNSTTYPVEYVYFLYRNTVSGRTVGCADETTDANGEYSCVARIPEDSGTEWILESLVIKTTNETVTVSGVDLGKAGIFGTQDLNIGGAGGASSSTPDTAKPAFTTARTAAPKTVAPGGELECTYYATDNQQKIRYSGCEYDMNGSPLACIGPTSNYGTFVQYCKTEAPTTATPGDTWTMTKVFAQDNNYRSTQVARSDTFTVYDCAEAVAANTVTNAWLGDQDETAGLGAKGGYAVVYEFWVKPTVNNAEAKVLLSENVIAVDADADLGVRFDASGFVQALDNGVWTSDVAFPYVGGTWYQVRIKGRDITEPVPSVVEPRYDVQIAACGNPFTQIITDAVAGNGTRIYTGIAHWNMFAAAGQTLDLNNMAWTSAYCTPTQCFFESPAWDCGTNIPNGCGGVIASCGVGAGACPTPGDTCGGGGTPYVCGQ